MAKTKNTATKNSAPVIVRNTDINSLEKRVYDMDGAKIRNYDLFSLEKRIYDLEQGGTPGPTPPTPVEAVTISNHSGIPGGGTYTATRNMRMYLVFANSITDNNYHFTLNGESASAALVANMISSATYQNFTYIDLVEGDTITWYTELTSRYFCGVGV